jgi:RNA polymerase sigma factor (sigma-70 family)
VPSYATDGRLLRVADYEGRSRAVQVAARVRSFSEIGLQLGELKPGWEPDDDTQVRQPKSLGQHTRSPVEEVMARDEIEHLRRVLGDLEPTDRAMIEMHFFRNMDLRSIAKEIGASRTTAQNRVQAALAKLYKRMRGKSLPQN